MSILNTASLVAKARKEGLREAADVVDRFADRILKDAEMAHRGDDYEAYEALECQATLLCTAANKIRNRARRAR